MLVHIIADSSAKLTGVRAVLEKKYDVTSELLNGVGVQRCEIEAARADAQATLAERNQVLVAVIADVARAYIDMRGLHACDIARSCGAEFEGREHDALEDARSLTAGVRALIKRGARHPFGDAR